MFRNGEPTFRNGERTFRSGERTFPTAEHRTKACLTTNRILYYANLITVIPILLKLLTTRWLNTHSTPIILN